jgi:integrase
MARPATGSIVEHRGANGEVFRSLRFRSGGRRHTLPLGVVSHADAERELAHVMADVARGLWKPQAVVETPVEVEIPTFHAYAEQWWTLNEREWSDNTRADYRWRLEGHLIPFFGETPIDKITAAMVKRYTAAKLLEADAIRDAAAKGEPMTREVEDRHGRTYRQPLRAMTPRSINMTVATLRSIMESAIDDDDLSKLISRNPARGRRVKEKAPRRSYLDTAKHIAALLDAAGELDRDAKRDRRHIERRAMISTLVFGGLRIGELCALRERDLDVASGWLSTGSKTDAGQRKVKIRGALRDELLALRGRRSARSSSAYVYATRTGAQMSPDNFRSRVLSAAVKRANANLEAEGLAPLPERITPHSLRRTFASVLYALGETPPVVMQEMGHTDPALALRVYASAMRFDDTQKAQLRALVEGADWANMGERGVESTSGEVVSSR